MEAARSGGGGLGGFLRGAVTAAATGEGLYKTVYRGAGVIYTEPTRLHLLLGEVGQLLHQVGPVAGHRVLRVVAKAVDRPDVKAALAQVPKQDVVGASREAVAVRENNSGHGKCRCAGAGRRQP